MSRTRNLTHLAAFLAGLAVLCWIGAGYVGVNAAALAVTLLIGGFYLGGAFELHRYRQATAGLAQAVAGLSGTPASLGDWLGQVPAALRHAVRQRIEGERVALPGPALTPYLVGLLVLLGMLGTFLGMVATLRGTGIALESASDLQAMRASLAAPVKGLGFAFGTSVAGVATSAMLGLLSALSRRERLLAVHRLDGEAATSLRVFSRNHQRDAVFDLLARQAEAMPALVDRLQAMMTAMERQGQAQAERLAASQEAFHGRTEQVYTRLAASVEQSLKDGIVESTRAAGATIQPMVEATMAGLAHEATGLRDTVAGAVQQHLGALSSRFETVTAAVADHCNQTLAEQRRTNEALARDLGTSLDGFTDAFAQRSAGLVEQIAARLDTASANTASAWEAALSRHEQVSEQRATGNQQALASAVGALAEQAASLVDRVAQSHAALQSQLAAQDTQRLAAWRDALDGTAATLRKEWEQVSAATTRHQQQGSATMAQAAADITARLHAHAEGTTSAVDRLVQAAAAMQADSASHDEARLKAWTAHLDAMAAALRQEWEQAGASAAGQQQALCETMARTAGDLAARLHAHADGTMAGIDRLVQAAAATQAESASHDEARLKAWTAHLDAMAAALRQEWQQAGASAAGQQQALCETMARTAGDLAARLHAHADGTMAGIDRLVQAAAATQAESAAHDEARLKAWTAHLDAMAAALRHEWEQAGASAAQQQQALCDTITRTAADLAARTEAQSSHTIAEVARLAETAAEAPKAAAEVIADLRRKLSDDMARDNALLDERSRLLASLATLLDAVNHTAAEQRTAVDTLVTASADLLERVGTRFTDHVAAETGKLSGVAGQVTASAVEVASLGEAFGTAVQLFSASNDKLAEHLQRIEAALDKSMARSDEQLAYYVAQAREVVDLSMRSQKQVLEDLQQFAGRPALGAAAA